MLRCRCLQHETQNVKLESVTYRGLFLGVAAGGVLQGVPRQVPQGVHCRGALQGSLRGAVWGVPQQVPGTAHAEATLDRSKKGWIFPGCWKGGRAALGVR